MQPDYFVGVDGGGTRCRARLTDKKGTILAEACLGAANLFSDFNGALSTAMSAVEQTFYNAGLPLSALSDTVAGFGFAGANITELRHRVTQSVLPFAAVHVASDVEIACLGAHSGSPGAVLIVGTGSQGAAFDGHHFHAIGGWGFNLGDQGSGAILGRSALRSALLAHDNILTHTPLTRSLMAHFSDSPETLLNWSLSARPADWGRFAPEIFQAAQASDPQGLTLVSQLAEDIDLMLNWLLKACQGDVALMGGIAKPILPYLPTVTRERLVSAKADALQGALRLATQ
ncbi:N-acetylglucosamine kinase [Prodigiosinella confusarubida]|uniref:N-acetylglucosamine kinase n=1 Tax=Serratia sp. (strain ATCC 39006) TaxID=104623 RepID=A0A2I5T5P8_SERS3|nr:MULTISPECIES: BadF/BadG/BcrA/BcrD ATPase family protein [Enterobacterales]WJV57213.1 BadF/BadG/BcrA/BcrD ATPase family protein [Pectobacteriaceae bacterium C111]WJY16107.1 BadF/BadG/BcrA/BcrD ATPase family protein [Pectobacteriaceae bacterium CE90]AUG99888.1 N-acetylglucosamine kinase [Serratia sp. ATCC 39006]AUH04208.1 N-acetylglucosamine kinase [Serratia sp. ATCC 39006]WJV52860.1 BadF/BadG/BcrA/BcrD ATPase family protein [Prodigiosinella sp. LS101]